MGAYARPYRMSIGNARERIRRNPPCLFSPALVVISKPLKVAIDTNHLGCQPALRRTTA
jgi:hypothetical protein